MATSAHKVMGTRSSDESYYPPLTTRRPPMTIIDLLQHGTMKIEGFVSWSSNHTFLVKIGEEEMLAIYKPMRGERPLWDFDEGTLYKRERAAYLISDALGWNLVPATVIRDGEHGIGSVQRFIPHDPNEHYFTFENEVDLAEQLQKITLFDLLINNADRKGGHILLQSPVQDGEKRRLWAIDHGVCFHDAYKIRTIVWQFAGEAIPSPQHARLAALHQTLQQDTSLSRALSQLLSEPEQNALQGRLTKLVQERHFWQPGPGRHYPWPPI